MAKRVLKGISAVGITGMSNIFDTPAKLVDPKSGLITPALVLNADVLEGNAVPRGGYVKRITLTRPHSLWSNGQTMLCVAEGATAAQALYLVGVDTATELESLPGIVTPMSYVHHEDVIYYSSAYWRGIYDLRTASVRRWGIDLPAAPIVSLTDGNLVPGHYRLCYTALSNGAISGNGPILDVAWDSGNRGLLLENYPAGAAVWLTHPNGGELFLGTVDANNVIDSFYGAQKLPTLDVIPPPNLQWICFAFGRIWGASGKYLYYSEAFRPDAFKKGNFFKMPEDITLIAPISDGLFVGTRKRITFLDGKDPKKMSAVREIPAGAVPGSLSYGLVSGGGYQVSRKLSQIEAAIWNTSSGIVMGVQGGHVLFLTDGVNKLYPRQNGATLVRDQAGHQQIITTAYGIPLAEGPPAGLAFMLDAGKVGDRQADLSLESSGGFCLSGKIINS